MPTVDHDREPAAAPPPAYAAVATAPGAWTCPVRLPPTPSPRVRRALADLARAGHPVAAFLFADPDQGGGDGAVGEVLLYRDPSRTHGTPDPDACRAAVRALVATSGWTAAPDRALATGVLVGLGLREGYHPGAPQHEPNAVARALAARHTTGWTCRPARLASARLVDGTVRWYEEPGVVVHAEAVVLPALTDTAHRLRQHRFTVTDLGAQSTYALQHTADGRPLPGDPA